MHRKHFLTFASAVRSAIFASLVLSGVLIVFSLFLGELGEGLWAGAVAFLVAFPACLVIGIPSHWLLTKIGWNRPWHYAFAGSLLGMIVLNLLLFPISIFSMEPGQPSAAAWWLLTISLAGGLVVGLAFWFFSRPRKPFDDSQSELSF